MQSFMQLKQSLKDAVVLKFPNPALTFHVHTDSSGVGIGGALSQDNGHGLQPIAFTSRKMNPAETRYLNHEQELLAVIHCLKEWRHWLLGGDYVVHTDNKSLIWLRTQSTLSKRQARWLRTIEEFDVKIEYIKGTDNTAADAFSCQPHF